MFMTMNVDSIRVPNMYTRTPPQKRKLDEHMLYYMEHGSLKQNIVVTQRGVLMDGYCSYIVAVMCGMKTVQCEVNTKHISRHFGKNRTINNPVRKRKILFEIQRGKCAVCGKRLQIDNPQSKNDYLTFDHILPVSRGGSNRLMNLQGLCYDCNFQKQDKYQEDSI